LQTEFPQLFLFLLCIYIVKWEKLTFPPNTSSPIIMHPAVWIWLCWPPLLVFDVAAAEADDDVIVEEEEESEEATAAADRCA
jgi:hypothetical protein